MYKVVNDKKHDIGHRPLQIVKPAGSKNASTAFKNHARSCKKISKSILGDR